MFEDLINKYFFILFSLLPISIIAGPSISLGNVLIIVFSFLVYVTIIKEWSWIKDKNIQLLFFLYLYLIVNSFLAEEFSNSVYRNFGFIRFIVLFAAFNYFFFKFNNFYKIFIIWTIIVSILVIDIHYESINGSNILGFGNSDRIMSFFKDEAIAGSYVLAFYFLIIGFLFESFKNKKYISNYLIFIISIIFLLSIFVTGERSNTIKAFIAFIFFYFFIKNFSLREKAISSLIIILLFSIVFLNSSFLKMRLVGQFLTHFQTKEKIISYYNNSTYFNLYRSGVEVFKKYPYFGVGNKNYGYETCWDKETYNPKYYCGSHPHQIYFELLAEHGIIGTTIILLIFFRLIFNLLRKISLNKNKIQLGGFIYIFLIFIPILPGGAFFSDYLLTLFFINVSILFSVNKDSNIFSQKN